MQPALDFAGHRVPRTKPTCLLHTWRPHQPRPFYACSSPAPTPVKPQPAPAILSQESVHTTLLITHHTRKPPSTGPRTTHGPQARTRLHWPSGPSNEAYLSSPHLEASPATTFHTCYSPAPTPVKPKPAPAILSQESVHTTLSITHHTRKRPSTGSRTTHGPQSPP
jgi:hypothetical protein